jgi:hypothetical protein
MFDPAGVPKLFRCSDGAIGPVLDAGGRSGVVNDGVFSWPRDTAGLCEEDDEEGTRCRQTPGG